MRIAEGRKSCAAFIAFFAMSGRHGARMGRGFPPKAAKDAPGCGTDRPAIINSQEHDRVVACRNEHTGIVQCCLLPFGPYTALTNGNGVAEWRGFDQDYRLTVTFPKIRPIWNKIWRFGSQAAPSRKVLKSSTRADHS